MMKRWCLAGAMAGAVAALAFVYLTSGQDEDAFTAKYRLIREGMTHKEAVQRLGTSDEEMYPGGIVGDHISIWVSPDAERALVAVWAFTGDLIEKRLVVRGGTVILSETYDGTWRLPWWKQWLQKLGAT